MALMYAICAMWIEATPSNLVYEMQQVSVQHIPLTMLRNRHEHKTQPKTVLVSAMRIRKEGKEKAEKKNTKRNK